MNDSNAANFPVQISGSERILNYRPMETRRIRRERLESAETARELGNANTPMDAPFEKSGRFGVVFSDEVSGTGAGQDLR